MNDETGRKMRGSVRRNAPLALLIGGVVAPVVLWATIQNKDQDPVVTSKSESVDVAKFGLVDDPTCKQDQTARLQAAIDAGAGKTLVLPKGTFCVGRANGTLKVKAPDSRIVGQGATTILKWHAPAGTPIAPLLDILPSAQRSSLFDLAFDHGAETGNYKDSRYFGTNVWGGTMVAIEADEFNGARLWGRGGFDNCFGVSALDASGNAIRGAPKHVRLTEVTTENCGSGVHSAKHGGPGRIGAGINNGSGTGTQVSNAQDTGSFGSFIADIGAAGSGVWYNIVSTKSRVDKTRPPALYVGDNNNSFYNVLIEEPEGDGIWSDGYANGSNFANINVKAPGGFCLHIKGNSQWFNIVCSDPSYRAKQPSAAIKLDATASSFTASVQGFSLSTPVSRPSRLVDVLPGQSFKLSINGNWPRTIAQPKMSQVQLTNSEP